MLYNASNKKFYKVLSYKDRKEFCSNSKNVYKTVNEEAALAALTNLKDKWGNSIMYL